MNTIGNCITEAPGRETLNLENCELQQTTVLTFTYGQLTDFHRKRCEVNKEGDKRSSQSLKNQQSIVRSWMAHAGVTAVDPVGVELGVKFPKSLGDYISKLRKKVKSEQTVSDRKSALNMLRESFVELTRTGGLPADFKGALSFLINASGASIRKIAKAIGTDQDRINSWATGASTPKHSSLPKIEKLELFLKVTKGTLSSRLPEAIWGRGPLRTQTTPWRQNQSELIKLKYYAHQLPDRVEAEWNDLVLFFTDPLWVAQRGFKSNSEWRIRWNGDRCVTAEIKRSYLRSFLGFLCLPTTNEDERLAGLGFSQGELTVAMLGDADLVFQFIHFKKLRSVNKSFNTATVGFLQFCLSLLRKGTGYLRQSPELGMRLPQPVPEGQWGAWCTRNYQKLSEIKKQIKKSKNNGLKLSRDPFAAVADIIKQRQHPISALFEVASKLESLTPLLESRSKGLLAVNCRDIFLIRLLSSNPLRIENISMMQFVPKSWEEFENVCRLYCSSKEQKKTLRPEELYVATDGASNLFQKPDGSWWLRFDERDFKNEKVADCNGGDRPTMYEVRVVPSVWPSLVDYLFKYRAVINQLRINAILKIRLKRDYTPLTPEEEIAINRCPYVFRPGPTGVASLKTEHLLERPGTYQMSTQSMSQQILKITTKYLPDSKGFCAHACRHLVATEYIKNHPHGYDEAAVALRNSHLMVRRHYAWVDAASLINPWSDHYEQVQEKYNRGEL